LIATSAQYKMIGNERGGQHAAWLHLESFWKAIKLSWGTEEGVYHSRRDGVLVKLLLTTYGQLKFLLVCWSKLLLPYLLTVAVAGKRALPEWFCYWT
jgi:hypothetical protein